MVSQYIIPVLVGFCSAGTGWFVTHWLAAPLLQAYRLRARAKEELVFYANVSNWSFDTTSRDPVEQRRVAQYYEAGQSLRRLAAEAEALNSNMLPPIRWLVGRFGVSLASGAAGLIGVSNTLDQAWEAKAVHVLKVEKAFRLPLSMPEDDVKESWKVHRESRRRI